MEYDGDNDILFHAGGLVEDVFGTLLGAFFLSLPIVMIICCYLSGRALGKLA
jgi:hypothetical protein